MCAYGQMEYNFKNCVSVGFQQKKASENKEGKLLFFTLCRQKIAGYVFIRK